MALDMFLKLDGIVGESTHKGHKDEIEVLSFSWGVTNSSEIGAQGRRRGRATPTDINFVMHTNKATPLLFKACATGRHLKQGIFVIEKAGEQPFPFYTVTLTDILVSSFQTGAGGEDVTDQFSLAFRTLRVKEVEQTPKGTPGDTVEAAFDFVRRRAL
jgi:type VI secretion system secreted protein Hcp